MPRRELPGDESRRTPALDRYARRCVDAEDNPGPDTIGFEGSLAGQIDLGDHLSIHEEVTISGSLRDPSRITIDGGGEDRIFTLGCDGETVTIEGLTLTHGRTARPATVLAARSTAKSAIWSCAKW